MKTAIAKKPKASTAALREKAAAKAQPTRPIKFLNLLKTRPHKITLFAIVLVGKTAARPSGKPEIIKLFDERRRAVDWAKYWRKLGNTSRCYVAPIELELFTQLLSK